MSKKTIKLGNHEIKLNGSIVSMYPDSGATGTIIPKHMLRGQKPLCTERVTVLNGRRVKMGLYRVNVVFNGKRRVLMAHGMNRSVPGSPVWMGYNDLNRFGVSLIDISPSKRAKRVSACPQGGHP